MRVIEFVVVVCARAFGNVRKCSGGKKLPRATSVPVHVTTAPSVFYKFDDARSSIQRFYFNLYPLTYCSDTIEKRENVKRRLLEKQPRN